ncbi:hypothetical protein ACFWZW_14170, partial [Microbacterium enclense]|uniref:hypothetical protein n=1 Tax=Microbacterium enclense TaxID=993073 RepID=UPI0036DF1737
AAGETAGQRPAATAAGGRSGQRSGAGRGQGAGGAQRAGAGSTRSQGSGRTASGTPTTGMVIGAARNARTNRRAQG